MYILNVRGANNLISTNRVILTAIVNATRITLKTHRFTTLGQAPEVALLSALTDWRVLDSRPLVLLIDDIDSLSREALSHVCRQLRSGFADRPEAFPYSVVRCGAQRE